jgi:hypothetical protein
MKVYAVRRVHFDQDPTHIFDSMEKARAYIRERTRGGARDYGVRFKIRGYEVE